MEYFGPAARGDLAALNAELSHFLEEQFEAEKNAAYIRYKQQGGLERKRILHPLAADCGQVILHGNNPFLKKRRHSKRSVFFFLYFLASKRQYVLQLSFLEFCRKFSAHCGPMNRSMSVSASFSRNRSSRFPYPSMFTARLKFSPPAWSSSAGCSSSGTK